MNTDDIPLAPSAARPAQQMPCLDMAPMQGDAIARLTSWFAGQLALTRREAHHLLEYGLASGYLHARKEEHVAAIKALATGQGHHERFRLLPDA